MPAKQPPAGVPKVLIPDDRESAKPSPDRDRNRTIDIGAGPPASVSGSLGVKHGKVPEWCQVLLVSITDAGTEISVQINRGYRLHNIQAVSEDDVLVTLLWGSADERTRRKTVANWQDDSKLANQKLRTPEAIEYIMDEGDGSNDNGESSDGDG